MSVNAGSIDAWGARRKPEPWPLWLTVAVVACLLSITHALAWTAGRHSLRVQLANQVAITGAWRATTVQAVVGWTRCDEVMRPHMADAHGMEPEPVRMVRAAMETR